MKYNGRNFLHPQILPLAAQISSNFERPNKKYIYTVAEQN
jgi:hypothetical protein